MAKKLHSIFDPGNYPAKISVAMLILRMVAGAFMLTHGQGKLAMLFGDEPVRFSDPIGIGAEASLILVVFAEVLCSILVIFGIATRLAVIPLLVTMLVAALIVHAADPFGRKELPLLFATVFIVIALTGAGKYSIDYLISKKLK